MSEHESRGPSDDLDRAIDAVARDMVGAEAPASMRASVLARLDGGSREGWIAGHHRPAVWAVAAAGIAVAIGLWVSLPFEREQPRPAQAVAGGAAEPAPVFATPQALGTGAAVAGATGAAEPSGATAATAATTTVAATRPWVRPRQPGPGAGPESLPRLAAIEPLAIDPLAPPSLALEDIRVAPMGDVPTLELPGLDEVLPEKDPVDPHRKER